jgi:hypothetical protein
VTGTCNPQDNAERNLADFMLDDSPPTSQTDRISDILNNAGVTYTHDHQNVLLASHVERNITSAAIAVSQLHPPTKVSCVTM